MLFKRSRNEAIIKNAFTLVTALLLAPLAANMTGADDLAAGENQYRLQGRIKDARNRPFPDDRSVWSGP
jgi:hypothetical protein